MRVRWVATFLLLTPAGCAPSESEQAKRELALIQKTHGDVDQVCAAKRKLADAYLHENNEREYEFADLDARVACNSAALGHRLGL